MSTFAIAAVPSRRLTSLARRATPVATGNRLSVAVAGMTVQIALGGVQSWSVLRLPLADAHGWSISQVSLAYTVLICMLGPAAMAGGIWLRSAGPRTVTLVAALCYGAGTAGAGIVGDNLWLFYLSFAVLGGFGRGLGFIVPFAVLVRWFPDRRGFAAGIAMCGIGIGALVAGPLILPLVSVAGAGPTFIVLGTVQGMMLTAAALALRYPPAGYRPAGTPSSTPVTARIPREYDLHEALRTPRFYGLWLLMLLSTAGGHGLITEAVPMAQEFTGVTVAGVATLLVTLSLANIAGRLLFAWVSDRCGRQAVFVTIILAQACAFALLPSAHSQAAFIALGSLVMLTYGGACSASGAMATDFFGARHTGAIFGLLQTSSGAAAILGSLLLARLRETTGAYTDALLVLACIIALSAVLPLLLRIPRADAAHTAA